MWRTLVFCVKPNNHNLIALLSEVIRNIKRSINQLIMAINICEIINYAKFTVDIITLYLTNIFFKHLMGHVFLGRNCELLS